MSWIEASDNQFIEDQATAFINKFEEEAKSRGVYDNFKYLNYANGNQDPIGGYGEQSKAKLQEASRKYDPEGFFQKALPGGFKLFT